MTTEPKDDGQSKLKTLDDFENEVSAVRNFSVIGVAVFAAAVFGILIWETDAIPLEHHTRGVVNVTEVATQKLERELEEKARNNAKAVRLIEEEVLEELRAVIAERNFGALVNHGAPEAVVVKVVDGSTAAGMGVKPGDAIRAVNGTPVVTPAEYHEALMQLVHGQEVTLTRGSGGATPAGVFHETVHFLGVEHAVEHAVAHARELVEGFWEGVGKKLAEKLAKRSKMEKDLAAAERLGKDGQIENLQKDLKLLDESYAKVVEDQRAALNMTKIRQQVSAELKHAVHELPGAEEMLLMEWYVNEAKMPAIKDSEQTKRSFMGRLLAALHEYYEFKVTAEVNLEHNKVARYPDEQRVEDRRFAVYDGFMSGKLVEYFGTPREPRIKGFEEVDEGMLRRGERFYFRHCQHCHGVSGYADGPTAPFLDPRPRNFTMGIFKFRSNESSKPSQGDLLHVLKHGLNGSLMPNFAVYAESDLQAVAQYVRYLAIRGEVEYRVHELLLVGRELPIDDPDENPMEYLKEGFEEAVEGVYSSWQELEQVEPEGEPVTYADDPEEWLASVRRGEELFRANCASCHGYDGQGGGEQSEGMYDSWGYRVNPRNLTRGVYRAGSRPIDLYWRISVGIKGSGMPAFPQIEPEQRWDLVNYVKSLALKAPPAAD